MEKVIMDLLKAESNFNIYKAGFLRLECPKPMGFKVKIKLISNFSEKRCNK